MEEYEEREKESSKHLLGKRDGGRSIPYWTTKVFSDLGEETLPSYARLGAWVHHRPDRPREGIQAEEGGKL